MLLGTSLGGTIALDFALAYPEAVAKLVLVDAQGFIDGIGPMSTAPRFMASLGVQVRLLHAGLRAQGCGWCGWCAQIQWQPCVPGTEAGP